MNEDHDLFSSETVQNTGPAPAPTKGKQGQSQHYTMGLLREAK